MSRSVLASIAFAALTSSTLALADPPAHAPAHGWRKKHDPAYVGYTGTPWERDFQVASGTCNREEIGAVVGGVIGGTVAARNSSEDNRTVAVIIGAAAGALIGSRIGRALDDADRGCIGHALEIGVAGRPVRWTNPATGVHFSLEPGQGRKISGKSCRQFTLVSTHGQASEKKTGTACQVGTGVWRLEG